MRKKLKVRGNQIDDYRVDIVPIGGESSDQYHKIDLRVTADGHEYRYDIFADPRHPDLAATKVFFETNLAKAKDGFLKVEVTENKGRRYLHIEFQTIGLNQYTGDRTD